MIPRTTLRDHTHYLPAQSTFWVPSDDDISEEGIGFFRDTWLISDVSAVDAADVVAFERQLAKVVDTLAIDASAFDALAEAVEGNDPEAWPEDVRPTAEGQQLRDSLGIEPLTEGLDLGVAGLVYALAAAGCWPAASCGGRHEWSSVPVVYFATDRRRAEWLQPLVAEADCCFGLDPNRGNLLMIMACSILDLMNLAQLILRDLPMLAVDGDHRTAEAPQAEDPDQLGLF